MRRALIFPLVLFFVIPVIAQRKEFRYGDTFQMEEPIKKAVKLPTRVLSRVFKDSGYQQRSLEEFEKTVVGTFVDLNGDRKDDFLVQGDDGANITGFWLFRNAGGRQTLVFHTRALALMLLKTKHNGMRDLASAAATAVTLSSVIYRYSGNKYRPYRCWSEDMGDTSRSRKKTFYRCTG